MPDWNTSTAAAQGAAAYVKGAQVFHEPLISFIRGSQYRIWELSLRHSICSPLGTTPMDKNTEKSGCVCRCLSTALLYHAISRNKKL